VADYGLSIDRFARATQVAVKTWKSEELTGWYISKSGFTPAAEKELQENGFFILHMGTGESVVTTVWPANFGGRIDPPPLPGEVIFYQTLRRHARQPPYHSVAMFANERINSGFSKIWKYGKKVPF